MIPYLERNRAKNLMNTEPPMNVPLFGNIVNEYYVDKIRAVDAARAKRLRAIRSADDARRYVASLKRKVAQIFPFPARTPLAPVVTAVHKYDGYTVENLYFYSRPNWPVTANFYLPTKRRGKLPGVLIVCGHANEGKACDTYSSAAIGLVLKGFAVLVIDPVEQGERKQYRDVSNPRGNLCANHNMMGKQLAMTGEWLGVWRTWDAVRGLDYLETRPEVDASRLMVTGNSGGGTLTTWVAAADSRPIAVAPSCYVTSWLHNIENELPADIEQMPPRILEFGMEMGDLLLAQAPRDILVLGQKNDFFDARGVTETAAEVRRINALLGGRTESFTGPTSHGFSVHNRQAMYAFFLKVAGLRGDAKEPPITLPPEEETFAAKGDVFTIPGTINIRSIISEKAAALAKARKPAALPELRKAVSRVLGIDGFHAVPHYRVLRTIDREGTHEARFALETEPGRPMAVLVRFADTYLFHLEPPTKGVTLYVADQDSRTELLARPAKAGETVFGLDVRSIGETMPIGTDQPAVRDFYAPYQSDYHYAALGTMFGEPIVAGKVCDVLAAIELLADNGARKVRLEGRGLGAIPALFAALLSDKVNGLVLTDAIESFEAEANNPASLLPLSCIPPGILKVTDIPEILSALRKAKMPVRIMHG